MAAGNAPYFREGPVNEDFKRTVDAWLDRCPDWFVFAAARLFGQSMIPGEEWKDAFKPDDDGIDVCRSFLGQLTPYG